MLQIVHDVAPEASLAFATAFSDRRSLCPEHRTAGRTGLRRRRRREGDRRRRRLFRRAVLPGRAGRRGDQPRDRRAGVEYFTAAGNDNLFDSEGREIASWEAPEFRDTGSCPASARSDHRSGASDRTACNSVPNRNRQRPSASRSKRGATLTVDLQWAEPWYGVNTDLDAYLLNSAGEPIDRRRRSGWKHGDNITNPKAGRGVPVGKQERTRARKSSWRSTTASANRATTTKKSTSLMPRLKFALLENGGGVSETQYPTSSEGDTVGPTIFGHSGAAAAITRRRRALSTTARTPEGYSSRGPVTHYFGPVSGTTPAARTPPRLKRSQSPTSWPPTAVSPPSLPHLKKAFGGTAGPRLPLRTPPGSRL